VKCISFFSTRAEITLLLKRGVVQWRMVVVVKVKGTNVYNVV